MDIYPSEELSGLGKPLFLSDKRSDSRQYSTIPTLSSILWCIYCMGCWLVRGVMIEEECEERGCFEGNVGNQKSGDLRGGISDGNR